MRNKILILGAVVIIAVGAYAFYSGGGKAEPEVMMEKSSDEIVARDQMEKNDDAMMDEDTMEKKDDAMMDDDKMMGDSMIKFSGIVLAGTSAPLLDFNKADFDKALASDKLVVLYFYANWCPECKAEFPKMQEAFNELTTDKVIAFRVNYNDNETDDHERDLAREHGVAYQHTKVFVKNRERILKSPESWEKERYIDEINSKL